MSRLLLILLICGLAGCQLSSTPDKNLSRSNIIYVELSFPNSKSEQFPIRLDSSQLNKFALIIDKRRGQHSDPENCYNLFIKLKNGGAVNYRTDGINFQGYDDSSDLPFSFSVEKNILTEVFELKHIEHCK